MKLKIELIEGPSTVRRWSGWKVTVGDKYADGMCYEEMLVLVATITMPEQKPYLRWLKTKEEHKQWHDSLKNKNKDVDFEDTEP